MRAALQGLTLAIAVIPVAAGCGSAPTAGEACSEPGAVTENTRGTEMSCEPYWDATVGDTPLQDGTSVPPACFDGDYAQTHEYFCFEPDGHRWRQ